MPFSVTRMMFRYPLVEIVGLRVTRALLAEPQFDAAARIEHGTAVTSRWPRPH
jgi:hypothetical protein